MSTGARVAAADAALVAAELIEALADACERIEVAGSLRRGRPDVGDIELVAMPKSHAETPGLFDDGGAEVCDLRNAVGRLITAGTVERLMGGARYVKLRHVASGIQVDLFMVRAPASWGVLYLLRTGPADYSRQFVTDIRWSGLHVRDGAVHRGRHGCGESICEVLPTPEEADVYAAAGWPFVAPEMRA